MEKDKVINELLSRIANLEYEVERQDNIIKEAIEFIGEKKYWFCDEHDLRCEDGKKILEILDKGELN